MNFLDFDICILAGGKSSRMGEEKGLVAFRNKPMIQQVIEACEPLKSKISIVTQNDAYAIFGKSLIADNFSEIGPIGGIEVGLTKSKAKYTLFLPCDVPLIENSILDALIEKANENNIVIASDDGMIQPLVGIYPESCLAAVRKQIELKQHKLSDLLEVFPCSIVNFDKKHSTAFSNLNTKEELWNIE